MPLYPFGTRLARIVHWLSPVQPAPHDLDPEAAIHRQVKAIEVRARTHLREQFVGEFRSAFRGRGLEFSDIRAYLPGDDVRFIDWNVTARRGEPYIKQFVEEREQTVFLLLDVSASESFGTVGRSVQSYATEVAGLLGFAAALNNDRVGAAAFSSELTYTLPPRKGSRHILRLLHDLLALQLPDPGPGPQTTQDAAGTDLPQAIEYASRLLRRGSVIFIISDFLGESLAGERDGPMRDGVEGSPARWDAPLRRLAMQHDVVALVVHDPHEAAIPAGGLVTVQDSESGQTRTLEADVAARHLSDASQQRLADLPQRLRAANVDFALLPTDEPYLRKLLTLFRARTRRQ
ncbi:MAG TPA: DUF58 domain-containing protein [Dehalococcoidia bacterium]|nr:DUF58 domain-containing protein [Dehalococcoidia bacterium]